MTSKEESWSGGTNSRLTFDVNVTLLPFFLTNYTAKVPWHCLGCLLRLFFFTSLLELSACCQVLELFNQRFVPRVFTTKTYSFIFSDFREKFSLVLLQMIYYILSPWKISKRMQYSLNHSGTRFLYTEN